MPYPSKKFSHNPSSSFRVIRRTDRQTDRQTDQTKNITFFGGGNNTKQNQYKVQHNTIQTQFVICRLVQVKLELEVREMVRGSGGVCDGKKLAFEVTLKNCLHTVQHENTVAEKVLELLETHVVY